MRFFSALLISSFCVASSACGDVPTSGDCSKLAEHVVDLEIAKSKAPADKKNKHREELLKTAGAQMEKRCNKELKGSQVTCALKAKTMEEFEKCDG